MEDAKLSGCKSEKKLANWHGLDWSSSAGQIKLMGTREHAAERDFSGIPLEEEVEESLKESAVISMGTEISEMDLSNIVALCDQVICQLASYVCAMCCPRQEISACRRHRAT